MLNWYPGMKVACVPSNESAITNDSYNEKLISGAAYTLAVAPFEIDLGFVRFYAILLVGYRTTWDAKDFRPLDELLNEEIQELLQPQTVEV